MGQSHDAYIIKALANQLHTQGQTIFAMPPIKRSRRLLAHIPGHREGDVIQRPVRIIVRTCNLGWAPEKRDARHVAHSTIKGSMRPRCSAGKARMSLQERASKKA